MAIFAKLSFGRERSEVAYLQICRPMRTDRARDFSNIFNFRVAEGVGLALNECIDSF